MTEKVPAHSKKIGRPTVYTEEFANLVLDTISKGGTAYALCSSKQEYPCFTTVYAWKNPEDSNYRQEFGYRYFEAEKKRLQALAEQHLAWTQPESIDATLDTGTARGRMPNSAEVSKIDMCLRNRQWIMAKMAPAMFGPNPHRQFKIDGDTGSAKLASLMSKVSDGEISVAAAVPLADLIRKEAEMNELKELQEQVATLKSDLEASYQAKSESKIEVMESTDVKTDD